MRRVYALLAGLLGLAFSPAQADVPLAYTLQPILQSSCLSGLAVTLTLVADASGRTVVDLPDHYGGQQALWKSLHDFSVRGTHARLLAGNTAARLAIRSDPHALLVLR